MQAERGSIEVHSNAQARGRGLNFYAGPAALMMSWCHRPAGVQRMRGLILMCDAF